MATTPLDDRAVLKLCLDAGEENLRTCARLLQAASRDDGYVEVAPADTPVLRIALQALMEQESQQFERNLDALRDLRAKDDNHGT